MSENFIELSKHKLITIKELVEEMGRENVEDLFKNYELYDYLTPSEITTILKHGVWNKDKLARRIVDHFLYRKIGFYDIEHFIHMVRLSMDEIMQEKLYYIYSASLSYNPLVNVDYSETFTRNINSNGSSESTTDTTSSGLGVNSDTPQGQISKETILAGDHASSTSASETTSNGSDETTTSSDTEETYTKHMTGNSGALTTSQALIKQYRETIIAIDNDIIKELNTLFYGLYD